MRISGEVELATDLVRSWVTDRIKASSDNYRYQILMKRFVSFVQEMRHVPHSTWLQLLKRQQRKNTRVLALCNPDFASGTAPKHLFSALTNFWLAFCIKSYPASTAHRTIPTTNSGGILENNYRIFQKIEGGYARVLPKNDIFGLLTSLLLINEKILFFLNFYAHSCLKTFIIYSITNSLKFSIFNVRIFTLIRTFVPQSSLAPQLLLQLMSPK